MRPVHLLSFLISLVGPALPGLIAQDTRLSNVSVRTAAGGADVLITGFTIGPGANILIPGIAIAAGSRLVTNRAEG